MAYVVDKQRNQLLRELIWPVVVGAVGYYRRHPVGVVIGPDKMVRAGLGSAVRTMRIVLRGLAKEFVPIGEVMLSGRSPGAERRLYAFRVIHSKGSIDLIGRDMVEHLALIALRKTLPIQFGGLKQAQGPHYISPREGERVFYAPVNVGLSGKVDNPVDLLVLHQFIEAFEVAYVHLDKLVVRLVLYVLEIGKIACVSELVNIDNPVVRILVHEEPYYVRADKACPSGDYYAPTHKPFPLCQ